MITPADKYYELIRTMSEHLYHRTQPDPLSLKRIERAFGSCINPGLKAYGLGYLSALQDDIQTMCSWFEQACQLNHDPFIPEDFLALLQQMGASRRRADMTLKLAAQFSRSEYLSYEAAKVNLALGDQLSANFYINTLCQLVTASEEHQWFRQYFDYHQQKLHDAYQVSGCLPEQLRCMTYGVFAVLDRYKVKAYSINIGAHPQGYYRIELNDADIFNQLTTFRQDLYRYLAEEPLLKNCPLIPEVVLPALCMD